MRYILFALLLISSSVFADDSAWLCIGEHGAKVSEKNGELSSSSFLNNEKWIITSDGLKTFGSENVRFNTCDRAKNGMPVWCERSDVLWGGNFLMRENKVFVLSGSSIINNEENVFFWITGKCSKL